MSASGQFKYFTQGLDDPYDGIEFCTSRMTIHERTITEKDVAEYDIEHPRSWSSLAVSIVVAKYLRKAGVPSKVCRVDEAGVPEWLQRSVAASDAIFGPETSFKQVFDRLAGTWAYWGWRGGYFKTESDARTFYNEIRYLLVRQMAAPNSPQWFNTGLHWAYGITGEATGCQFYVDPATDRVVSSKVGYERPQPHACFILSVQDKLIGEGGLQDLWHKEALMFKFGSGVGGNFSSVRAINEPLSSGGVSSGVKSFLMVGDRSAGAIKSGGTTRRAAKMVILDIDHPDIEEFINWKTREEDKVLCLVAGSKSMARHMQNIIDAYRSKNSADDPEFHKRVELARMDGMLPSHIARLTGLLEQNHKVDMIDVYDAHWEGEAYRTVSGQNANNSVRLTDEFMKLIDTDEVFALRARTDMTRVVKTPKARDLWGSIAFNAWACADPGVQFDTRINEWHTCPASGRIRASNPCSEYMFLDDTACNLASLSLVSYTDTTGKFVHRAFEHACMLFTYVLEISVHMAQFPSPEIARRSYDFRTLGLGYANIGSLLMRAAIPYDSEEACTLAGYITALMTGVAYRTSAEIAAQLGAFQGFAQNREHMMRVIRNHARAIGARNDEYEELAIKPLVQYKSARYADLLGAAQIAWRQVEELGERYGFRNAQVTVIAPTGTIGLVMDCDTTGCEPEFALVKYKTIHGGGLVKIINNSVPIALRACGYTPAQIDAIQEYILGVKNLYNTIAPINATTLAGRGFGQESIKNIQGALGSALDLDSAISTAELEKQDRERIEGAEGRPTDCLGFSLEDIEASQKFYYGTETIEGAPHIRAEHLPIFDCASVCGQYSQRSLHWQAHLKFLSAIQPFISGAISKTVNMPKDAKITDCAQCYKMAWELGLKAVALYRDGSKSQPLSASQSRSISTSQDLKTMLESVLYEIRQSNMSVQEVVRRLRAGQVLRRRSLPAKRYGFTQKVYIGGQKILLRTGEYPDGTLGEIFIDTHKEGAMLRGMMNCFAMLFSLALQHDVPLEELFDMFNGTKFGPAGPVVGVSGLFEAESVIDALMKILHQAYIAPNSQGAVASVAVPRVGDDGASDAHDDVGRHDFLCDECGAPMMIIGNNCKMCQSCGAGTGCSG
jgi:ribonucleoside-diphosphate reductase alpha chain